jgi:23S rRNA pseudouridine2604 synthase
MTDAPQQGIRLSKLMSERGLCSRREADSYIAQGLVIVDGQRISELGTRVDPGCKIELARKAQQGAAGTRHHPAAQAGRLRLRPA